MAMVFVSRNSLSTMIVLSCILTGCGDRCGNKPTIGFESHAKVVEASAQLSCQLGAAYNKETEKCDSLIFPESIVSSQEILAQFIPVQRITNNSKVINKVVADKNGIGCVELTAKTELPLSLRDCKKLAHENSRKSVVFIKLGKVVHVEAPVIIKGEEWFLYQDEKGDIVWNIPQGNVLYKR